MDAFIKYMQLYRTNRQNNIATLNIAVLIYDQRFQKYNEQNRAAQGMYGNTSCFLRNKHYFYSISVMPNMQHHEFFSSLGNTL